MWSSRGSTASVLRTPSAPDFWDANFVRVEGDASDLEPLALVKAADALLADSRHRKLEVQDEARRRAAAAVLRGAPAGSPTATR